MTALRPIRGVCRRSAFDMFRRWRVRGRGPAALALAACVVLSLRDVAAHDLPRNTVMSAFVKVQAHEAHLVLRVPLEILQTVQFPLSGSRIDLPAAGPTTQQALRDLGDTITIWENGLRLVPSSAEGRLSLPSDRSFEEYEKAVAHVAAPLAPDTEIYSGQGHLDAHFTYRITLATPALTIQTTLAPDLGSYLKLTVRYLPLDGASRAFMITSQSGRVALDPTWYQAAGGFVRLGFGHILSGADHLLFLLCLVIPCRRIRDLVAVTAAFTVGHSVTLLGAAYNMAPIGAWFPSFIETAIAASIAYMALENIAGATLGRRWIITGLFGLVHGFGFSYALKEHFQFAGSHLLVALFSFNVGIEIGQLAVLPMMVGGLALLFRGLFAGRIGIILLSAVIGHTAGHWMIERGTVLWQSGWPRLDGPSLVILARWVAGVLVAVGAAKLLRQWVERRWPTRIGTQVQVEEATGECP